jgi:VWFA-related protein
MTRWILAAPAACGIFAAFLFAQDGPLSPGKGTADRSMTTSAGAADLRVFSDLVLVPVMVTNSSNELVTGLGIRDFHIFEDQVEQEIRNISSEDVPVSTVFVFDTSGSMKDKILYSREALREFAVASNPQDEYSLVTFNDSPKVATDFTPDCGTVLDKVLFSEPKGRTALLDAVWVALDLLKHAHYSRKAILIISDGGDNRSRHTENDIKKRVLESDVQIYSIGIFSPLSAGFVTNEEALGPGLLRKLSGPSGGRFFEADSAASIESAARVIGVALRNQYVLAYAPSTPKQDGKYHRITVKLDRAKGEPKLHTSFRTSYFSPIR